MFQIFALFVLAVIEADCESFTIHEPASGAWNNEVSSCLFGGYKSNMETFYLGKMADFHSSHKYFMEKRNMIHIFIRGDLSLTTGREGTVPQSSLTLKLETVPSPYPCIYKGNKKLESTNWWASQLVEMTIKVALHVNGTVFMESTVGAKSSWALTCATAKANVKSIQFEL